MEPTLKVLQRRAYSFLLTRAGCGFALVSLLLTLNTLIAVVFGGCYVRTILTVRAPSEMLVPAATSRPRERV